MQIGFRSGRFQDVACDLLGYPLFEDADTAHLGVLEKETAGAVSSA